MTQITPELLIPAGTFRKIQVALNYGADAVYVGASGFSMRPDDVSFSIEELHECVDFVKSQRKHLYVGVNSLIMQSELEPLKQWFDETKDIPFDALIIADPAMILLAKERRPDVEIHISTQLSTANSLSAKFWKEMGAKRIVLARECSLKEAAQITHESELPVEIFVHGAMCVAVSGRCLLSAYMTGHNASKGQCKHSCRWGWELREAKRPGETYPVIETEKNTIFLSSTDLCLLEHIPEIVKSGVASLKVEGRMKSEHYIAAITRSYRAALDSYTADPQNYHCEQKWLDEVNSIRHQPHSTGFAFGYPTEDPTSLQATHIESGTHDFVGIIETALGSSSYDVQVKHPFHLGETLEWIGPHSRNGQITIDSIVNPHGQLSEKANPGTTVQITTLEDLSLNQFDLFLRPKPIGPTKIYRTD